MRTIWHWFAITVAVIMAAFTWIAGEALYIIVRWCAGPAEPARKENDNGSD